MSARHRARKNSPLYLPGAFELFKPSRDLVLDNLEVFGILYILPFIFWAHSWMWVPAGSGHYWDRFTDANYSWSFPTSYWAAIIGFSIIWFLITVVAGTLVQIMLQRSQLDAAQGKKPDLGHSWDTAKQLGWRMLGLYVAMGVIIVVGFILLIIPGLIMLRRYILAPYVMLDKKCGIRDALDKSAELSAKNTGAVWGVIGVMFLIGLLGIVPIIGSLAAFVGGALYSVAPALRYQQLKNLG